MAEFFINFSRYIDEDSPVKIRMIGETQQEDSVNEERRDSDIMALEYIVSGEGILEIDGKTYYPKVGDCFLLKKEAIINILQVRKTVGIKYGLFSKVA